MADSRTPAGPPALWLAVPGVRPAPDSLDLARDGTRIILSLTKPKSDIWLVERK